MSNPKHLQPARTHQQITGYESSLLNFNTNQQNIHQDFVIKNIAPLSGLKAPSTDSEIKDVELKFNRLKQVVINAGIRAVVALFRQFKFFETENGGTLDFNSFQKALDDFQIPYVKEDIQQIF